MAATVRDDSIPRSIMFLCLGASIVLLVIQWRAWASSPNIGIAYSGKADITQKHSASRAFTQSQSMTQTNATVLGSATIDNANTTDNTNTTVTPDSSISNVNLVVDLGDRHVYLYQDKKKLASYPLAVGKDGWETPTGTFKVIEMQKDPQWLHPITKEVFAPGPDNPLGKRWIGFSINGQTHIGFHGTNQEKLIGQAVSHGCLRMRNRDVIALYEKVKLGTPVTVRP
jgi:L,D-transpeptidase ErfK/SrfK